MNQKNLLIALLVVLAATLTVTIVDAQGPRPGGRNAPKTAAGSGFTYQGQLKNNGALVNGTCDLAFRLYDDVSAGNQIGSPITQTIPITNGLFTTQLNASNEFGANAFNGDARWLDVQVRCPTGIGSFTPMTSRQALTPAPLALALPGLYTQQNLTSPNVIGGYSGNVISPTVVGATIGGGGSSGSENRAWGDYAIVGGGRGNTASGSDSSIPGGVSNLASGSYAMAAGRRAQALHNGAFVWGDSTNANVASTAPDQFVIRASGGVSLPVNAGNGGTHPFGEHWRDNAIQAWASVNAAGSLFASYGVSSVAHSTGIYTFTLQVGAVDNTRMTPVVTPEIDAPPTSAAAARLISVNTINGTTFVVYITNGSYVLTDNDFVMMMTGR